ncbi:GAF domain-containing sensor histidine kinase [Belnapia rosea]|uniref:GAF domain-containing sensor histidine kinase n=1 Tax=Belnapia rosea TaxID=938405 RepID=UPI00088826E0|nr:GAF domain-containing sensor histidine kinase [Belnapia rosea]SDB56309.1 GAF domain-containing protein [Belnapia rosea]
MSEDLAADLDAIGSILVIPTILDIVCRTTGMRFAAVARVTERRWVACAVRDVIDFGLAPGGELPVESTLCHEVRAAAAPIVIDDVAADPVYGCHHTPAIYRFRSYISVPIRRIDGSVFGTLCAIDPDPRRLNTPETIDMFEMFANVIGHHLSAVDQVKAQEASLLDERRVAALREEFIAVLGHDLRNPLAAIAGGMRLLRKTPLNSQALELTELIQGSVGRMSGLVDNLVDFARFRLGGGLRLEKGPVQMENILQQIIRELQAGRPGRVVETAFRLDAPIVCDGRRMAQLASNLLGNAFSHGAPDQPIRVAARTEGRCFELSVANGGEPIPPDILGNLFQPFSRGTHRPNREGLGLGLYIAHQIAEAHGGRIEVVSTPAETRFTLVMPIPE